MIDIVMATVSGREKILELAIKHIEENTPGPKIYIIKDLPSAGEAWNAGVKLVEDRQEYLYLAADDLMVQPGWAEAAMQALQQGIYPAPRLVDINGKPFHGKEMRVSYCPFMTWELWDKIGPTLNQHYGNDDFLSFRACQEGYRVKLIEGYKIVNHKATVGRLYGMSEARRRAVDGKRYHEEIKKWKLEEGVS